VNEPLKAAEIISQIFDEVAPERALLLKDIVALEEIHLSDSGTTTASLVASLIEKASKVVGEAEVQP
jgi:hypothetical protein